MFIAARFIKVLMDFYIEYNFLKLLIYFIRQRKNTEKQLNSTNCIVIGFIATLYIIFILQSILIFAYTFEEAFFYEKILTDFVFLMLLSFTPLKDYLIALGFAGMYYRQGMKGRERVLSKIEQEDLLFNSLINEETDNSSHYSQSVISDLEMF